MAAPAPPNVNLSFGPMLMGVFINMILYGVLLVQIYHYHLNFRKDVLWIKCLVYYLLFVETVNTGCDIAIMYQPLIVHFGLPDAVKFFPTMFAAQPIVVVAVSTPIQIFFAWRIKLLTKSSIIPFIISILAIVSLAGGTWTTVRVVQIKLFARKPELHHPALVWFIGACLADVIIAVVLVLKLSKRRTGFAGTDDAISRIIRMTVQTGFLTAVSAVGDVVFFMTLPHTALNFIWDLALSKLYSNCLLSALNARSSVADSVGYTTTAAQRNTISSGGRRHKDTMIDSAHNLDSSVYELNAGKTLSQSDGGEYGVTVTKIIETSSDKTQRQVDTQ